MDDGYRRKKGKGNLSSKLAALGMQFKFSLWVGILTIVVKYYYVTFTFSESFDNGTFSTIFKQKIDFYFNEILKFFSVIFKAFLLGRS